MKRLISEGYQFNKRIRLILGTDEERTCSCVETYAAINILGVIEIKLTGVGEFNSDDHYIYYCRQESLRRNGVTLIVNKRV